MAPSVFELLLIFFFNCQIFFYARQIYFHHEQRQETFEKTFVFKKTFYRDYMWTENNVIMEGYKNPVGSSEV